MNIFQTKILPSSISLTILALVFSLSSGFAAGSTTLMLDDFKEPVPLATRVVTGTPGSPTSFVTINESGLFVPGGARDTTLNMYGNPLGSIAVIGVGDGNLSTTQGTGVTAETLVKYGAFTRVGGNPIIGGPHLGLDLSEYASFQLVFSGAEDVLNVNVTYYTSAPLDPANPLYYSSGGTNVAPMVTGASLTVKLPVANNPLFNWQQVDGIVVLINRSGPTPATSYTLDSLIFSM